jgi:hypothetical protein
VGSSQSITAGALGDRARDRDALLLAAGELGREVVHAVAEADELERLLRRHRRGGDLGDDRHVFARGQARDQVVELEHEADVVAAEARQLAVAGLGQVLAVVPDVAVRGHVETAQDVQERGLAAAGRAEQHHELAGIQIEIDAAQGVDLDLAHAIHLGDAARAEDELGFLLAHLSIVEPGLPGSGARGASAGQAPLYNIGLEPTLDRAVRP